MGRFGRNKVGVGRTEKKLYEPHKVVKKVVTFVFMIASSSGVGCGLENPDISETYNGEISIPFKPVDRQLRSAQLLLCDVYLHLYFTRDKQTIATFFTSIFSFHNYKQLFFFLLNLSQTP